MKYDYEQTFPCIAKGSEEIRAREQLRLFHLLRFLLHLNALARRLLLEQAQGRLRRQYPTSRQARPYIRRRRWQERVFWCLVDVKRIRCLLTRWWLQS